MTAGEAWLQKTAPRAAAERPSKTGRLGDHARDAPHGAPRCSAAAGGQGTGSTHHRRIIALHC